MYIHVCESNVPVVDLTVSLCLSFRYGWYPVYTYICAYLPNCMRCLHTVCFVTSSTLLISTISLNPFHLFPPRPTLPISLTWLNSSHLSTACRGYLRWGRTQLHLEGSSGHIRDNLLLQPSQRCWLIDYLQLIHRFELLHMSCIYRCSTSMLYICMAPACLPPIPMYRGTAIP